MKNDKQLKKYNLNYLSNIYSTNKNIQRNQKIPIKLFYFLTSQSQLSLALSYGNPAGAERYQGNREVK